MFEVGDSKLELGDRVVVVAKDSYWSLKRGVIAEIEDGEDFPFMVDLVGTGVVGFLSEELEQEEIYEVLSGPGVETGHTSAMLTPDGGDVINHPSHYADGWSNGAEVIDLTEHLNFNRGNAVKYLARAGKKGGPEKELEDLQKALWYIRREVLRLGGTVV